MALCKFDVFENEAEMEQLIKGLQDRSSEYLKIKEPWDIAITNPIKDS